MKQGNLHRGNRKRWAGIVLMNFCFLMLWGQEPDSSKLQFPIQNNIDPTQTQKQSFDLGDPSSVKQTIVYDPITGKYIFKETIGSSEMNFRNPSMMTLEEYIEYERRKSLQKNWKDRIDEQTKENQTLIPPIKIPGKLFQNIFGSDEISIRTQGSVEISMGVNSSRYDNPQLPVNQRRITRFDFQQQMQLNLVGQIGTRIKLNTSYNTQAAFDFDNISNLAYNGDEDQIVQKVELGNVNLPLNTSLIQGSQTLFGAKTQLRFGRLTVDGVVASSKGKRKEINIEGKAQVQNFEVTADNYEANRHYFLSHYFREAYDGAMAELPIVNSEINITRIEVWLTNRVNNTENTRNILAFSDLGESREENLEGGPQILTSEVLPMNGANTLYKFLTDQPSIRSFSTAVSTLSAQNITPGPFKQAVEYEKVENARRLSEQEFSYNPLLGFISLNQPLNNDEVLAVAFEYTYRGETYQVGELSNDGIEGTNALILKLLKPTIINPGNKVWDLMMKNVYSIGAYQVDKKGFRLDILYNNPETSLPVNFFPYEGLDKTQLVTLLEMDKLNMNNQPFSDGLFDFAPMEFADNKALNGGTINPRNGRIYFSTAEPFGKTLLNKMVQSGIPDVVAEKIAYTELYDSTKTAAQQIPSKNRFLFRGQYESSVSSDIPLNALNVPQGAVSVTAGGIKLVEGTDYTVDYNLGRVKILNTGILESNTPIKISIESNSVFGFQSKSLIGSHLNYRFSKDFNVGATWMRMMERPVTQKVDMGNEPFKNNILGLDVSFKKEVPFLTKLVDYLPGISTRAKSDISFTGEVAHLIPGTPRAITKDGISYVDDFEGSQSTIDLRTVSSWRLASVPQGQSDLFPEASSKKLDAGFRRSHLSWYLIDLLFYQNNSLTPQHIKQNPDMLSDSRMRLVQQQDLFPNLQQTIGSFTNIPILELAYYPRERGMYNYDTTNTVDAQGLFTNPENRWAGIQRSLTTNNFEQTNIEFIQVWMLDPFNEDAENVNPNSQHSGGDLYFNLGNISEDALPDSRKSFENGLPIGDEGTTDQTPWARVSTQQVVVNAFDNNSDSRLAQDLGLDGYNNQQERQAFASYVSWVQNHPNIDPVVKARMINDPSNDDYTFYRDDNYDAASADILMRYKRYNGMEGNSFTTEMSDTANADGYPTQATNLPDNEDINQDNNISETESYFQYRISLRPSDLVEGKNYITNIVTFNPPGSSKTERWIQFKIPVAQPERVVNGISDFRSIRFMRMFMKNFDEEVVLRFARLEFIRGEWRRYLQDLTAPGESIQTDPNLTSFNISAVNIEENSEREPIKYVLPPGIQRELDASQPQQRQLNEQALQLEVCGLKDGDARAAYKNVQFDVRTYKKMKMYVHAEEVSKANPLNNEDLTLFIRLGTDFTDNYYEYELPLNTTPWYSGSDTDIWPESNFVEISFDDLLSLKRKRNKITADPNSSLSNTVEYVATDPQNSRRRIKVKGSPNLQGIRTIMIGIRNPGQTDDNPWQDDGLEKCAIVWVNELYLSDFENSGGSAAVARLQMKAADFATVSMSGSYKGINWGSVESRVQERQRNEQMAFDFNTNMQLGQFFGKKARLSVPFFYAYSVGVVNPEFDPFNPDVRLKDYEDLEDRRRRAKLGQDYTELRSYNFTNVRKERKEGAKAHVYDLANWTLSYAHSENLRRDFNLKYDRTKLWTGSLNYAHTFKAKPLEPFKKVKFMENSKWWTIVREMNLYLTPKNIAFENDLQRSYNERQIRNNLAPDYEFNPVYVKSFFWNRKYRLDYDITKKLKFGFNSTNRALFDEANGRVDRRLDPNGYQQFKDSIWSQMQTFGKTTDYTHDYYFNYSFPFEKIPALNWVSANVKYTGSYNWQRAPLGQSEYGHIIQNSRNMNFSGQLNFVNLYKKVPFFEKVLNDGKKGRGRASVKKPTLKPKNEEKEKPESEMTPKEKRQKEREERREKRQKEAEKKRKGKVHPVAGYMGRLVMSVRNVSGTYSINDGSLLPGYARETRYLGFSDGFSAPLSGFVFGKQPYDIYGRESGYSIARTAAANGWLVKNPALNRQHTVTHSQNMSGRASLEPMKDLSIELSMNRVYSLNSSEFFRWNDETMAYEGQSRMETGNLTYSTVSMRSAFTLIGKNYQSDDFDRLLRHRSEVSGLLGRQNGNSKALTNGYYSGYDGSQQEVVIGAFLAAYTNNGINERSINPIKNVPLPNWTINYNGLTKYKKMQKYVKNFVVRHGYSSSIGVTGLQTNLKAQIDANGNPAALDLNQNFISQRQMQNITISERFSPLIGFDATWKVKGQGLITKFEINKNRSIALSLSNNQVTEIIGKEIIIGSGYKFTKVKFPFKLKGKRPESDVNLRFSFKFSDNLTVIRKVVENTNQATAGQRVVTIQSSADYNLGKNLTLQLYYDQVINTPKIATSYPTGNTSAGLRLRLNLAGL
ncbi:MAG: cell surface protein SprA [Bacteroidetes bacterium]|nr:MAG: cell surface protein SprA [Bacteroidota bacterium]